MQLQSVSSTPASAGKPLITDAEAGALARATVNLAKVWELADAEACALLGGMSARTWARWKDGSHGRTDRDLRARMADLMGIHEGLRYLFKDPSRGYEWIRKPNAAFGGLSALQIMLRGDISDLAAIRDWLEAEGGSPPVA
ncbi:MbcA/ParS/Xre antitoxin family protein [Mesorhizobium sp. YIM 152430]|uniref:MbcA/ParS/Xre antitoxin family protein n=1 Tax=Mesorhizobium sp. YIM 152430 TaxID=3031761 RepID=UPI0023D9F62E|nr:MbcA/ParS/Xre antitoxin family protein [Mesorhizobium sp. YIM 152430]MDF1600928.1 MbcA/ParS/Xre antitoxin family protein [Mesorhizobium sp. YIM 152430]